MVAPRQAPGGLITFLARRRAVEGGHSRLNRSRRKLMRCEKLRPTTWGRCSPHVPSLLIVRPTCRDRLPSGAAQLADLAQQTGNVRAVHDRIREFHGSPRGRPDPAIDPYLLSRRLICQFPELWIGVHRQIRLLPRQVPARVIEGVDDAVLRRD